MAAARMRLLSQPARASQLASVARAFHCRQSSPARTHLVTAWPPAASPPSTSSALSLSRSFTSSRRLLLKDPDNRPPPPRTYFQPGDQPPPPQYQSLDDFQSQAQLQQQAQSTSPTPPPPPPPPPPSSSAQEPFSEPDPDSQSRPRRRRRFLSWTFLGWVGAMLALGAYFGRRLRVILLPPQPEPGSELDEKATALVHKMAADLDIVKRLSADPDYESWQAYTPRPRSPPPSPSSSSSSSSSAAAADEASLEDAALAIIAAGLPHTPEAVLQRKDRLTTGPMGGYRGLGGYQRVWRHRATGETVTVVFLGPAVQGWPTYVHGGAIATLLDESLGRCAVGRLAGGTGVTAHLRLGYLRPTKAGHFYIVRCRFVDEADLPEHQRPRFRAATGAGAGDGGAEEDKRSRKAWVRGVLEDLDGQGLVEAVALFVAPKNIKLERIDDKL